MLVAITWLGLSLAFIFYSVSLVVYRLYFHPLSKFPGPKFAAATSWYEAYYDLAVRPGGQFFHQMKRLHQQYGKGHPQPFLMPKLTEVPGPVVRVNPHEIHVEDSTWVDTLYSGPAHVSQSKLTVLNLTV